MDKALAIFVFSSILVAVGILGVTASLKETVIPGPFQPSLNLHVQGTTKNDDFYNVSMSITNVIDSTVQITAVHICTASETDAILYLNNTRLGWENLMRLGSKDTLQVNFIFPTANNPPGPIGITTYTPNAMYYIEATLPP